jgi:hypothetical protein
MDRMPIRLPAMAVALVVLALSLGAVACGDSDDGGDASAEDAATPSGGGASEREQVTALMPYLRQRFNATDGKGFCAKLSAAGKREVTEYALEVPALKTRDCATFISRYTQKAVVEANAPHRPVRIRKVEVNGDKAKVTMTGGLAGIRSIATYKLAKEDGEWRLEDPISGATTRRLPAKYR